MLLMLIALVGGRIIPSFTRNWLAKQGSQRLPASFGTIDKGTLVTIAAGLALWVVQAAPATTGSVLIIAGLAAVGRLVRWRGYLMTDEPLLWVLHLGHAWLAVGLCLLGLSQLWPAVPATAALHAL